MAFKISEAFIDVKPRLNKESDKILQSQVSAGLKPGILGGDNIVVQNVTVNANNAEEFMESMKQFKQRVRAK